MQHIGRVDVLEAAQDLVDEGLEVSIGQGLAGPDDSRQITFHQLYWWCLLAGELFGEVLEKG